jgi:hypothetical protein
VVLNILRKSSSNFALINGGPNNQLLIYNLLNLFISARLARNVVTIAKPLSHRLTSST